MVGLLPRGGWNSGGSVTKGSGMSTQSGKVLAAFTINLPCAAIVFSSTHALSHHIRTPSLE